MKSSEKIVPTLCRQCDMHCGINVHLNDAGLPLKVSGLKSHPISRGYICAKGRAAAELAMHPDRIRKPLKRKADGSFCEISYTDALHEIADKMLKLKEAHGAAALGVWIGEALGFFQQPEYARRFLHGFGSPNFFAADSVCFSAVYMAYHLVKGYWGSFPDFENAKLIILWGTNPTVTYPPFMQAILRAQKKGAELVVVDPRATETTRLADMAVRIKPGTDGAFAWGVANRLIQRRQYDRVFVETYSTGFDLFSSYARRFTPDVVANKCGVSKDTVARMADLIAGARPRLAQLTGVALEHQVNGVNTLRTIASLSGLAGAEDRRGGELWPKEMPRNGLRTECDISCDRRKPVGTGRFPLLYELCGQCHSLTGMDRMLDKGDNAVRGLILTGANPVLTNPNAGKVARALGSLDLFVARELFHTETSRHAHYIFPNASFLERSELYCYADRQRIAVSNQVFAIPGVVDDYTFWRDLALILGFGKAYFPWKDEDEVNRYVLEPSGIRLTALKESAGGIVYDVMDYQKYRSKPFPTPSGKYEFICRDTRYAAVPEIPEYKDPGYVRSPDSEYPFVLISGARKKRLFNSRYRNIPGCIKKLTGPSVEMAPQDAVKLRLENNDLVKVSSRIGAIKIKVHVLGDKDILPGFLQITHGWDDANVNLLVDDAKVDPISGFPNMKLIPVKIEAL